jgi:hypothetical protein
MYDCETLTLAGTAAGFTIIDRRASGESRLHEAPDGPEHGGYRTLYVEMVR